MDVAISSRHSAILHLVSSHQRFLPKHLNLKHNSINRFLVKMARSFGSVIINI